MEMEICGNVKADPYSVKIVDMFGTQHVVTVHTHESACSFGRFIIHISMVGHDKSRDSSPVNKAVASEITVAD